MNEYTYEKAHVYLCSASCFPSWEHLKINSRRAEDWHNLKEQLLCLIPPGSLFQLLLNLEPANWSFSRQSQCGRHI